jgi:GNAT superfamily N-acetyltransferase
MPTTFLIRPASENDADNYVRIETDAYRPEFIENSETFLAKLKLFPSGCKIVDVKSESVAYLIAHPWTFEDPPALNSQEFNLPLSPDIFFIHSVTVMKAYQKIGVGSALVKAAISLGKSFGYSCFTLISVQASIFFWKKIGFQPVNALPGSLGKKIKGYGDSAVYMVGNFA